MPLKHDIESMERCKLVLDQRGHRGELQEPQYVLLLFIFRLNR